MSNLAIKVEGIGKQYRIGLQEERHDTLVGSITAALKYPMKNLARLRSLSAFRRDDEADIVWALRDVSFEVQEGEVVGIIGHNGAGKSTLLKILSRITEPSRGYIDLYGRVASLLEVGTGFHPELTGRENVFLNGTILGMTKAEIDRKYDEIVDFSGIEKFIDTPVKRYSSGMKVRLAFAVAAHLDPEILLIDEVLAVGDAAFQRKCLGKMESVARGGRTVLFVSHDMAAVQQLCRRCILLKDGTVVADGDTDEIIRQYLTHASAGSGLQGSWTIEDEDITAMSCRLLDAAGLPRGSFMSSEPINIEVEVTARRWTSHHELKIVVENSLGLTIFDTNNLSSLPPAEETRSGVVRFQISLPQNLFNSGSYYISPEVSLHGERWIHRASRALQFEVEYSPGLNGLKYKGRRGFVAPEVEWERLDQSAAISMVAL